MSLKRKMEHIMKKEVVMEINQRSNAVKVGVAHEREMNYLEYALSKCKGHIATKEYESFNDLINEYKRDLCYANDKRLCNHNISKSLLRDMHDHEGLYLRFDLDAQMVWDRCLTRFKKLCLDSDACKPDFLYDLFSGIADYLWLITSAYNSNKSYNSHPIATVHLIESQSMIPLLAPKAIEERKVLLDEALAELDKLESINSMSRTGRILITAVIEAATHEQQDSRLTLTSKELEAKIATQRNTVISMKNTHYALYATYVIYKSIVRRN